MALEIYLDVFIMDNEKSNEEPSETFSKQIELCEFS